MALHHGQAPLVDFVVGQGQVVLDQVVEQIRTKVAKQTVIDWLQLFITYFLFGMKFELL